MRILGVIPCRLNSERLPDKPLRNILGKPMLQRTYEGALQSRLLEGLTVATDSKDIWEFCNSHAIPCQQTGEHPCGTDRCYEVMKYHPEVAIIVNIQCDEPLVTGEHVDTLIDPFVNGGAEVVTMRTYLREEEFKDENCVKVASERNGNAVGFFREAVPLTWKHVGLYAYSRPALWKFYHAAPCPAEIAHRLEQLRFMELGIPIRLVDSPADMIGVDTIDDLRRVEELLARADHHLR